MSAHGLKIGDLVRVVDQWPFKRACERSKATGMLAVVNAVSCSGEYSLQFANGNAMAWFQPETVTLVKRGHMHALESGCAQVPNQSPGDGGEGGFIR